MMWFTIKKKTHITNYIANLALDMVGICRNGDGEFTQETLVYEIYVSNHI